MLPRQPYSHLHYHRKVEFADNLRQFFQKRIGSEFVVLCLGSPHPYSRTPAKSHSLPFYSGSFGAEKVFA